MPATKSRKRSKNGKSPDKIYTEVTERIIEALEGGTIPWHKPWRSRTNLTVHTNFSSKKPYRGINQFLLDVVALTEGYEYPYWLTYRQAETLGGNVRKGEKSSVVVFFKRLRIIPKEEMSKPEDERKSKVIPLLKYYNVFNIEQCENIELPKIEEPEETFEPIEHAQKIIDEMPQRPSLRHHGGRAYYSPDSDLVVLPKAEDFKAPEFYYSVAYHELTHSTGAESRTGRVKDWTGFGDDPYAKEELVAQMGAAMLTSVAGIETKPTQEMDVAYIQNWIARFKDDKKLVVQAAAQAQRAADFILGVTYENGDE